MLHEIAMQKILTWRHCFALDDSGETRVSRRVLLASWRTIVTKLNQGIVTQLLRLLWCK